MESALLMNFMVLHNPYLMCYVSPQYKYHITRVTFFHLTIIDRWLRIFINFLPSADKFCKAYSWEARKILLLIMKTYNLI